MNSLTHLTLTLTLICYWQWIIWWMRNVACDSSKQQTLSTSRPSATVTSPWHCPWGKSGMETVHEVLCFSNNNCIQLRFIRNNFSEPKHLLLPIHRKAVKSLTWNVWIVCVCVCVCVISSNLWCWTSWVFLLFYYFLFSKNSHIFWFLHYLLRAVPPNWEAASGATVLCKVPPTPTKKKKNNKKNLQLLGCAFFFNPA